jgi:hypothetical protein
MAGARDLAIRGLDKALELNEPAIRAHVHRMRRSRPDALPAEVVSALEKQFLAATTTLGAAAGASAAVPAVGTAAGVVVNLAEVGTFFEAAALFTLGVAHVHGVAVDDLERRRTLLMAVLMGSSGASFIQKAAGRAAPYWAKSIVQSIPMPAINNINRMLGPRFVTKYGTKQGILVLGREIPLGIGAAIGAGGNAVLARTAIAGARSAFGPAPRSWPDSGSGPSAGSLAPID